MKKGFTLTEIMIALAVIAILTVILMPMIFKMRPNQEVLMTKRAYNQTLTIVSEMINNEKCYPFVYDEVGFEDGRHYTDCPVNGNINQKFRRLFRTYISNDGIDNNFVTKDGMRWRFNGNLIRGRNGESFTTLTVDTTGDDAQRDHDTFSMRIYGSGKVEITGANADWAKEAVGVDRSIVGE